MSSPTSSFAAGPVKSAKHDGTAQTAGKGQQDIPGNLQNVEDENTEWVIVR
jgi:hypothetical protein